MEKDYYWDIILNIQESRDGDIEKFAEALSEFGFMEISIIASQTINRLRFLDELNLLVANPKTIERTVHKAFEKNTWLLGDDYSVIFSDVGMQTAVKTILDKKYVGDTPDNRPDLLFGRNLNRELCLIEFKRPDFTLTRETEKQAIEYRDDLNTYFHNQKIEIVLLGGRVKQNISSHNEREDVHFRTYIDIISSARQKLQWLIEELASSK